MQVKSPNDDRTGDIVKIAAGILHDAHGNIVAGFDDSDMICIVLTPPFTASHAIRFDCWVVLDGSGRIRTKFFVKNSKTQYCNERHF